MTNIIKITLLALALFLSGCMSSTTSAGSVGANRKQLILIDSSAMNQSAAQSYAAILTAAKNQGKLNPDPAQNRRVAMIAARLIAQTPTFRPDALRWQWQAAVLKSDELNAWCMPGGKIAVYTGIIERLRLTDGELAAIIGHEIAHALREHSAEQASSDALKNIGLQAITHVAGLDNLSSAALGVAAKYTLSMPFSRSHEKEADHIGAELMARAGYDPNEAINVWIKMSSASSSQMPEILSTHPSNQSRIKDLQETAKKLYPLYLQAISKK